MHAHVQINNLKYIDIQTLKYLAAIQPSVVCQKMSVVVYALLPFNNNCYSLIINVY